MSILCPCTRALKPSLAVCLRGFIDRCVDDVGRARFLTGSKLKIHRKRDATQNGRVIRASALSSSARNLRGAWPGANRRARHPERADVHDLVEQLVIASQHGGASSDEDSEGPDDSCDVEHCQMDKADFESLSCWNRKSGRMAEREQKKAKRLEMPSRFDIA